MKSDIIHHTSDIRHPTSDIRNQTFKYLLMTASQLYLESILKRFKEYKALGDKTFEQLKEEEMWMQPNEFSNSIGIIIRHMHGNMKSRWTKFLTEDGEKPGRNREEEFETASLTKKELLKLWEEGWMVLITTLESLEENDLTRTITIRTQPLNVIDALNRQLGHYGYHVGQIVYIGRWIRNKDWKSLSIPRGGSASYNEQMKQSRH